VRKKRRKKIPRTTIRVPMNRCQWNFSLRNMVASKKTVTELTPAIG
jgi:hypothetical protein